MYMMHVLYLCGCASLVIQEGPVGTDQVRHLSGRTGGVLSIR